MTINDEAGPKRSASYTQEERRGLLEELKLSNLHYTDFADQHGISRATFRNWIRWEATAPEQKAKHRFHGPYSPNERKKTIEAFLKSNMAQADFAPTWGVGLSTLNGWMQRYNAGGYPALDKYVPPKANDRRKGSRVPAVVREEIVAIKKREPCFGLRKIRDWLLRFKGVRVSPNTIKKTIRAEGLPLAIPERKRKRSSDRIRRFERANPMQLWQSDITSFVLKRHSTRVYLTVFMDDSSRYIVGWRLQTRQNADLVLDAFKEACARFGKPEEVLTDQGRQYFAWRGKSEFEVLLEKEGIKHVVSRAHHPETLGKCERFWKTVESEFWERIIPADLDEARERFKHFVDHYNHQRPHQGIGGSAPADRFFGAANEVRSAIEKTIKENALRIAIGETLRPPAFLIGQIGEKRIAFHGTSGQFFLTHENLNGEINAEHNGASASHREPSRSGSGAAPEDRSTSWTKDETAAVGIEGETELSSDPRQRSLGSEQRGRSLAGGGQSGDHPTVLDGSNDGPRSSSGTRNESTSLLADDTTSDSWFNGGTSYAAQNEIRRLDGEANKRG